MGNLIFDVAEAATAESIILQGRKQDRHGPFPRLWLADPLDPECQQPCCKVWSRALAGLRWPGLRHVHSAVLPRSASCRNNWLILASAKQDAQPTTDQLPLTRVHSVMPMAAQAASERSMSWPAQPGHMSMIVASTDLPPYSMRIF